MQILKGCQQEEKQRGPRGSLTVRTSSPWKAMPAVRGQVLPGRPVSLRARGWGCLTVRPSGVCVWGGVCM